MLQQNINQMAKKQLSDINAVIKCLNTEDKFVFHKFVADHGKNLCIFHAHQRASAHLREPNSRVKSGNGSEYHPCLRWDLSSESSALDCLATSHFVGEQVLLPQETEVFAGFLLSFNSLAKHNSRLHISKEIL